MRAQSKCQFSWRAFDQAEHSSVIWSLDQAHLFSADGTAIGGSDTPPPSLYMAGTDWYVKHTSDLKIGECTADAEDGSTWHTQRVGPFTSKGGYDFWSIAHNDFRTLREEEARLEDSRESSDRG